MTWVRCSDLERDFRKYHGENLQYCDLCCLKLITALRKGNPGFAVFMQGRE